MSNSYQAKKFTPEEEAKIAAAVKKEAEKRRQADLEAEIRNRIEDAKRKQPGYKY